LQHDVLSKLVTLTVEGIELVKLMRQYSTLQLSYPQAL